jgi:hypothetical protein
MYVLYIIYHHDDVSSPASLSLSGTDLPIFQHLSVLYIGVYDIAGFFL